MFASLSKAFFHALSRSGTLKKVASRYGMRQPTEFRAPLHRRRNRGRSDRGGPRARSARHDAHARSPRRERHQPRGRRRGDARLRGDDRRHRAAGIERNISLKLTQLGLDADKASAVDNLRKILERADPAGFFVRIDMEDSPHAEVTLNVFETLWHHGHRQIGVVLQSDLYRSERDLQHLNSLGARVRLVKGAYREPKTVAYQRKADVDAAYARMLKVLFDGRHVSRHCHPRSGDDRPGARLGAHPRHRQDRFEFQMLYGIRRDLQTKLVNDGYRLRIYVPFGRNGFRISCGGSANARRTCSSSCAGSRRAWLESLTCWQAEHHSKTSQASDFAANYFNPNAYGNQPSSAYLLIPPERHGGAGGHGTNYPQAVATTGKWRAQRIRKASVCSIGCGR
jgi:proline dehydrogenase